MNPLDNNSSLIEEIRSIVKREVENAIKKIRGNGVGTYSNIMDKAKPSRNEVFTNKANLMNQAEFTNKNSYKKMKNRVNYGFNSDSKTFVNKASIKK